MLNVIIFFTLMSFSFSVNNSVNQGKREMSLGIREGKWFSFIKQYRVHF